MKQILFFLSIFFFSASLIAQGGGLKPSQLKDIEAIMAPLRLKVEAELKKADAKMYADYLSDLKKAVSISDTKKQKAALTDLETKYYSFVKKGYAAANIDEVKMKSKLGDLLKGSGYVITFTTFLGVIGTYTPTSPPETAANTCKEFKCPFEVTNTTMSANLNTDQTAPITGCSAYCNSFSLLAGARDELSAVGEFATISPNMQRVDVSARFDYRIYGFAAACIGGGYADASVGVMVKGPNVDKKFEFISGWAVAPLVWFNQFEKTGTNDRIAVDFVPKSSGGDYKVQAYAKCYSLAGVISGAWGEAEIKEIDFLKACQIKK